MSLTLGQPVTFVHEGNLYLGKVSRRTTVEEGDERTAALTVDVHVKINVCVSAPDHHSKELSEAEVEAGLVDDAKLDRALETIGEYLHEDGRS